MLYCCCCNYTNYDFYFAGKQEHPKFVFQLHNGKTLMKKVYCVESSFRKRIEKRTVLFCCRCLFPWLLVFLLFVWRVKALFIFRGVGQVLYQLKGKKMVVWIHVISLFLTLYNGFQATLTAYTF
jgi:hypothetical protein